MFSENGPDLHGVVDDVYSSELRQLARRCVEFWPEERIRLVELRREIQLAKERRTGKTDDESGYELLYIKADKYKLGLSFAKLPAAAAE